MTRINLVPPSELYDQHLFAEFREIKMVPKSLRRSLQAEVSKVYKSGDYLFAGDAQQKALANLLKRIPKAFTLNTGHVSFFYDKGLYLQQRYSDLRRELERRGINYDRNSLLDPDRTFALDQRLRGDYVPTAEALVIIRTRIAEKVALKPEWYRYSGERP